MCMHGQFIPFMHSITVGLTYLLKFKFAIQNCLIDNNLNEYTSSVNKFLSSYSWLLK